jgi:asparagine synthase (glutamine-hydrolysing)
MSAIVGLYHLDQEPVNQHTLSKMTDALAHRGKDGGNVCLEGAIGLGHRMLWTTPESLLEKLPAQRDPWMITADARIDNRTELIEQLGLDRRESEKITDSDLILLAYGKWGEDCPEKLMGDFAFALWDQQHQKLFCARDTMGIKPFVYYYSPKLFAFASEIKALFQVPSIPKVVNELRIAQLMMRLLEDPEITAYENILRLPAAHCLTVAAGKFVLRKYWELDRDTELKLASDYEYAEAYREQLTEAVRCRMRSAFPIGSMLSGGLDSSSIACTARTLLSETNHKTIHTFSTSFDNLPEAQRREIDERFYVEKVLEQGDFTAHFIAGDRLNPLGQAEKMFWHIDEPFFAPNLYYNWAWYDRAKNNQVRVVMDGIDGDSTVSHGQPYLIELLDRASLIQFTQEIRAYAKVTQYPVSKLAWEWGFKGKIPRWLYCGWAMLQEFRSPLWKQSGLQKAFAEKLKLSAYAQKILRDQYHLPMMTTARHAHCYSLQSGLLQYALELADRSAAAFDVELRYPFCDRRLMQFCVSLPPEQKFRQGITRLIARRGTQGILPDEIRQRLSKANLGANTKPRLLQEERSRIEHYLLNANSPIAPYLEKDFLQQAYSQFSRDPLNEHSALQIYVVTNLGLWLDYCAKS